MTSEELIAVVTNLVTATTRNTESIAALREASEIQFQSFESQRQSIGNLQQNSQYNTQVVADGLELAAASNRTAAASNETAAAILASISTLLRAIEQQKEEIDDLKQIVGIVIDDSRADRSRIRNLEDPI